MEEFEILEQENQETNFIKRISLKNPLAVETLNSIIKIVAPYYKMDIEQITPNVRSYEVYIHSSCYEGYFDWIYTEKDLQKIIDSSVNDKDFFNKLREQTKENVKNLRNK